MNEDVPNEVMEAIADDFQAEAMRTFRKMYADLFDGPNDDRIADQFAELRAKLSTAAPLEDERFRQLLAHLICEVAIGTAWSLAVCLDGSGDFQSGRRIGLSLDDESIGSWVHENMNLDISEQVKSGKDMS